MRSTPSLRQRSLSKYLGTGKNPHSREIALSRPRESTAHKARHPTQSRPKTPITRPENRQNDVRERDE